MTMEIQLLHFFLAFLISFALYPLWIKFVYKYQMGEEIRDDGPESHQIKRGTPTMGGLVFVVSVALVTFIFNRSRTQTLFPLFVASLSAMFGLIEDFGKVYKKSGLPGFFSVHFSWIRPPFFIKKPWDLFVRLSNMVGSSTDVGAKTHTKFLIQGAIAGFVSFWAYFKLGWDYIWFPLIGNVHIGLFYPIFVFFLFMAVLNFVAFTDGLDGLAGGLALFALIAYWGISSIFEYNSLAAYCATFVGALLPFLYFNVNPARVFMGNVGSHVLGSTMVILAIILHREFALLFLLAVFLADGISSPLQQFSVKLTKKRIFLMAPLHHHFELRGWPEAKVTFRFWVLGIFFAFLGLFVALL